MRNVICPQHPAVSMSNNEQTNRNGQLFRDWRYSVGSPLAGGSLHVYFSSPIKYCPYVLCFRTCAKLASCLSGMYPMRQAISSGQAIFSP